MSTQQHGSRFKNSWKTWRVLLAAAGSLSSSFCNAVGAANASHWTQSAYTDRLTGEKEIRFTTRGVGAVRQFNRGVTATMVLRCINPYQDKEEYRSADEYSAVIYFSERIGVAEALFRYRFDANPVHSITATLSDRGDVLSASWPKSVDETFITELRRSTKLRTEIDLPWAGKVLLEFDTSGAAEALDAIPCGTNRPATTQITDAPRSKAKK